MIPTPTTIPITQILNFVILNISYLFSSNKYYYCTQQTLLEINILLKIRINFSRHKRSIIP